ncbi:unnamed protein product [Phyllotreta striolata]|uniref:FHA domain-containing protein n=1 Tax=Phyllotreta striolata TaxID=444603 RepID=A0A9N9TII6_PHYSR|nr:unnamed protein product [Phyllotreta striolata]
MLYFLKSVNSEKTYYLVDKNEFTIGRKDCDILILCDSSISKKHATIRIKEGKKDNLILLEDVGSKYKTFHNDKPIPPNTEISIKCNDKIKFGGLNSVFILKQEEFITTATKLSSTEKNAITNQLQFLNGKYVKDWSPNCTHLSLVKVTCTVKVLQALIDDKPIVSLDYWAKFVDNVKHNIQPPDINDYNKPPFAETLLDIVEIKSNVNRKKLFDNKVFVFYLDAEKANMSDLIEKAGGRSISFESTPVTLKDILKSGEQLIVMHTKEQERHDAYVDIIRYVNERNERLIPFTEVALAIIRGCCEKDCNPSFNRMVEVFNTSSIKPDIGNKQLVQNTQSQFPHQPLSSTTDNQTIPDTMPFEDLPAIKKRKRLALNESDNLKKIKMQEIWVDVVETSVPPSNSCDIQIEESQKTRDNSGKSNPVNVTSSQMGQVEIVKSQKTVDDSGKSKTKRVMDDEENDNPFKKIKMKSEGEKSQSSMWFASNQPKKQQNRVAVSQNSKTNIAEPCSKTTRTDNTSNDSIALSKPNTQTTINRKLNDTRNKTMNTTWMSKNTSIDIDCTANEEEDENLQTYKNLFKNNLIIESLSTLSIRPKENTGNVFSNKVNMKKFKKVKPLHPQNTVIRTDSFIMRDTQNITNALEVSNQSTQINEELNTTRNTATNVTKKTKGHRVFTI